MLAVGGGDKDCDKEKYQTCPGCTVSVLDCEWCNGDCQSLGTCNSAQVCTDTVLLSLRSLKVA